MRKARLLILFAVILSLGCACLPLPSLLPAPTPTATVTSTAMPTGSGSAEEDVRGIFCPTSSDEAAHAYTQGLAALRQNDWSAAEVLFLQAITADPEFCDALDSLGGISIHYENWTAAVEWYERSAAVNPDNLLAVLNLGYSYYYAGRVEDAIEQFEILTAEKPDNPEGHYGLGMIYVHTGQPDKAMPYLERAAELYAEDPQMQSYLYDTHFLLGMAHFMQGNCTQAISYVEPLVTSGSYYEQQPDANYLLGYCYYYDPGMQNLDLAKQYLQRAEMLGYSLPTELADFIQ